MKDIVKYINENIEDYDDYDFLDALLHYGELDHETLMEITNNKPIKIKGKEVDSIYWSTDGNDNDYLVYSYKDGKNDYEKELDLNNIPDKIVDKIYKFLCDNEDPNVDYFNSLPKDNEE